MTDTETKYLEAALHAKRRELRAKIRSYTADIAVVADEADPLDRIQSMTSRDATALMLNRFSSELVAVERSLRAMSEGLYGVCAHCEEPIALRRLQMIPWAAYCVRCQERLEQARKLHDVIELDRDAA